MLIASWVRCSSARVGRIPIITMCAPSSRARFLGAVELRPDLFLVRLRAVACQAARRHVDLEVEPAELGGEHRVVDVRKDLRVAQRGVAVLVDEVELDLHAGHRPLEVEARLGEHQREGVQAAVHLRAVALPVLARE